MPNPPADPQYRVVLFDAPDDPRAVRDLIARVTGAHPTDAMLWVARAPGTWPRPLPADATRLLLDGLYDLGVAAEAWKVDAFPELGPARTVHDVACLPEGFRVKGLRGEPTHWVPWDRVELICAGRVEAADEFRAVRPPAWPSVVAAGLRALTLRKPVPDDRRARATRVPRDPVAEVLIVRRDPRLAFRVVENQMNYAYLGDRLSHSATANFPVFLAELVARADAAHVTPSTKALLRGEDSPETTFETPQALLEHATLRLLWGWYQRDRENHLGRDRSLDETGTDPG